jgi:3-oxoadipate enol-lactonase
MPFATSKQAALQYRVRGQGDETLLLIMGLGGHASEWGERLPDLLAERYQIVTFDNRGIAESTTQVDRWTMQDMARDACAVLDAVGVPSAHVLGLSMGGMIAQTVALEHGNRVERLVLLSTSGGGVSMTPPTEKALQLFAPPDGITAEEMRRLTLEVIMAPGFAEANPDVVKHLVEQRLKRPTRNRVFTAQFEAVNTSDRTERLKDIGHPTLVIHGKDDSLLPVQNGITLGDGIPGAQLELLDDCGHMAMWEKPDEVADLVLRFLA